MSGVFTGTRLERLYVLRNRIAQEIAVEERRVALDGGRVDQRGRVAPASRAGSDVRKAARLDQLGVTARQVKEWAFSVGLVDGVHRGRVADALVDAYVMAHPEVGR